MRPLNWHTSLCSLPDEPLGLLAALLPFAHMTIEVSQEAGESLLSTTVWDRSKAQG